MKLAKNHPSSDTMPPTNTDQAPATNGESREPKEKKARIGPSPGRITSSDQYTSELRIRRFLIDHGYDPAREDTYRIQGVQLIDSVREYLQLSVALSLCLLSLREADGS